MSMIAPNNPSNPSNVANILSLSFRTYLRIERWTRYLIVKLHSNYFQLNQNAAETVQILDLLCGSSSLNPNHIGNYTSIDILLETLQEIYSVNNYHNNNHNSVLSTDPLRYNYLGIDVSYENFKSTKDYYTFLFNEKKFPSNRFTANFTENNELFSDSSKNHLTTQNSIDLAICMGRLHKIWTSDRAIERFLYNVSNSLKENSCFIGITVDSATIWNKAMKSKQFNVAPSNTNTNLHNFIPETNISISGELYKLHFLQQFDVINPQFSRYGCKFSLELFDKSHHSGYLIHFPELLRIANSMGLECLYITNLVEFYTEQQSAAKDSLLRMKVITEENANNISTTIQFKLPAATLDLMSLYCVFAFRKMAIKQDTTMAS